MAEYCAVHGRQLSCADCDGLPEYKESLDQVAKRFGLTRKQLTDFLSRRKDLVNQPPVYRWFTHIKRRRVFTASEIRRLDAYFFRTKFKNTQATRPA